MSTHDLVYRFEDLPLFHTGGGLYAARVDGHADITYDDQFPKLWRITGITFDVSNDGRGAQARSGEQKLIADPRNIWFLTATTAFKIAFSERVEDEINRLCAELREAEARPRSRHHLSVVKL